METSHTYDAIVIGGGLGGLSAAILLAHEGHRVLVLEQFARVGGYATTWIRDGVRIEGALHEIDDMRPESFKVQLLHTLGIEGIEYLPIPELYRVITPTEDRTLPVQGLREYLIEAFPEERTGIVRYFTILEGIAGEVDRLSELHGWSYMKLVAFPYYFPYLARYQNASVETLIEECFTHPSLRALVMANLGYYGDHPSAVSLLYFAIAQNSYYQGGGWFIRGGSSRLIEAIASRIRTLGSDLLTRARVETIHTHHGYASGVTYTYQGAQHRAQAPLILNNASPLWAMDALDTPLPKRVRERFSEAKVGPSFTAIYLVAQGRRAPQGRAYSTIILPSGYDSLTHDMYASYDQRPMVITDYGVIDSALSEVDRRFVTLGCVDRYSDWADLDPHAYAARKEMFATAFLRRLAEVYPDITPISYEVATPRTMERYTLNPQGAIYGYAQTPRQSGYHRMRYAKLLPNLINTSAWGQIGGGYSGVLYGAIHALKGARKWLRS